MDPNQAVTPENPTTTSAPTPDAPQTSQKSPQSSDAAPKKQDVQHARAQKAINTAKQRLEKQRSKCKAAHIKEVENAIKALETSLSADDDTLEKKTLRLEKITEKRLPVRKKSGMQEIFESLIFALLFALVLRTFLVEPFKIPTRSMVPTLMEGDQLFVTKLSYGLRLPFINKYVTWFSEPQRGDVVVFAFPREEAARYLAQTNSNCLSADSLSESKDYIKRIIGVAGDTIEIIEQKIYVNGTPIAQTPFYTRTVSDYMYLTDKRTEFWNTERIENLTYTTITHELPSSHFGPITVAPGHVFAMGDNRDNSADSRCWGQVPIDNIKGRAQLIWWSSGYPNPRWDRMFTWIH